MRLIDVHTHRLKEFHHDTPPYAILSHTWGDEEVTFQEYRLVTEHRSICSINIDAKDVNNKAGFAKIVGACRRAHADGLGYLWCDTNCIDKSSSAELTEAINSMYAWYRDSAVCYAYLADVGVFDRVGMVTEEFRKSRWFTRGWTLQELLAPEKVLFFNRDWEIIADRQQLAETIHGVTRVHIGALLNRNSLPGYSIAQRMSWAARRQTSRQEDIAYCLLGIFGINIPLLYGEGSKAFTRLQEEIIKVSDDQSILAWEFFGDQQSPFAGILAPSPREFASCGSIVRSRIIGRRLYSVTNLGVSLELPVIQTFIGRTILVELNCSVQLQDFRPRRPPQAANVRSWGFPVWIWLNLVRGNIYQRSSVPVSHTLLMDFYREGLHCAFTNLYALTSAPSCVGPRIRSAPSSGRYSDASTGFHVTIGFGRMNPRTRILEQAFPPAPFMVTQLPPRGPSALSHEIISAGNYAVLLTIVWDHQQHQPIYWRHGIFTGSINSTVVGVNNWEILFPPSLGGDDDVDRIKFIHEQIRNNLVSPTMTIEDCAAPFVHIEKDLKRDQHGQPKVVAHLAFQELGRR